MRIRHLSIRNFRGIRELDWALPDKPLFCLIGRGDSTKSTILEALRRVFYSQWNLSFDDADFYQCIPANTITIDVMLGDLIAAFRDLENYGQWMSGWDRSALKRRNEPAEDAEDALWVRLRVAHDLEPSWRVIKASDDEGVPFKPNDRHKVAVSLIGATTDRHLTWSRGSLLGHLTQGENLALSLAEAGRAAKLALEARRAESLGSFDAVAASAQETARDLGVAVRSSYKAHLDSEAINVRIGGLALHDGTMPLRQLGLGSKRMLTTGLQKKALSAAHITLFDEVEVGLEPHRIARLVAHLKADTAGQYFLSTHSPVVLRELTVNDLHIVHCRDGVTKIVAAAKPAIVHGIQGKVRSYAEAFLAPKIVVCEGATEVGFLRGLDEYWISQEKNSFACQGIAPIDAASASKIKGIASGLRKLSYDVAVVADSDDPQFSPADADELTRGEVAVIQWSSAMSIEQRVFTDIPWSGVMASFELACEIVGARDKVIDHVQSQAGPGFNRDIAAWTGSAGLRAALGKAAKASGWFKRQDYAQQWAAIVVRYFAEPTMAATDLVHKVNDLRAWIDRA